MHCNRSLTVEICINLLSVIIWNIILADVRTVLHNDCGIFYNIAINNSIGIILAEVRAVLQKYIKF